MDHHIFLGLFTIMNIIIIASAACPSSLCTCTNSTEYICDVESAGITVANLTTIIANAKTDQATVLTITKYLGASLTSEMFKSTSKLTKLTVKDSPAVMTIDSNAFKGLPALTSLMIMGTAVPTLPEALFTPLKTSLTGLTIMNNTGLASIPVKIFEGLTKLTKLELTDNPLRTLDASVFTGLTALVDLTISKTSITTLPETIFQAFTATLGKLNVAENTKLTMLPKKIFMGLKNLTTLDLKNNAIKTFSAAMFNDIKTVAIDTTGNPVNCSCNRNIQLLLDFVVINTNLTIKCATHATATVKDKDLKTLTKEILCPCPTSLCTCTNVTSTCDEKAAGITEADLVTKILPNLWNSVRALTIKKYVGTSLKAEMFKSIPDIQKLEIKDSAALTTIDATAFKGLPTLVQLIISGTSVTTLPETLFSPVGGTLLQLLITGNTKLALLPKKIFMGLTKLTTLDLRNNAIKTFSAAMFNDIKTIAIDTTGNPVDCSCNRNIQLLFDFVVINTNLTIKCATPAAAAVKDNDLKTLTKKILCPCPTALCTCTNVTSTCDKKAAGITEADLVTKILPNLWSSVKALTIQNYIGTSLKAEMFKSIPDIEKLEIKDSAALTTINATAFKGLPTLVQLTISGTSVMTLPETLFLPLRGTLLQLLITGNSRLAWLPINIFMGLTKLTTLDLKNNAIKTFSAAMFNDIKTIAIDTTGNPVNCSCNIQFLIEFVVNNTNLIIKCATPATAAVKDKDLKSLTKEILCPTKKSMIGILPDWAFVIIIAAVVAIILVVIGIFCQRAKRRHYEEQKRIAYEG